MCNTWPKGQNGRGVTGTDVLFYLDFPAFVIPGIKNARFFSFRRMDFVLVQPGLVTVAMHICDLTILKSHCFTSFTISF